MIGCVGVVSPGAMGSAVGSTLRLRGIRVVVALQDRSARSAARVAQAGLDDVGTVRELVSASDVVLSVVPPSAALDVATALAGAMEATMSRPIVVDANAISPLRAQLVARTVEAAGGRYIDGGIVGGPPRPGGRTDLFLSGSGAAELGDQLATSELAVSVLGTEPTAASALKMCYAAWTKGTSALLLAIRSAARQLGVDDDLVDLWRRVQPDVLTRSENEGAVAGRAWRWVDEMAEIARTFEDVGVPGGAAAAAGALYARLSGFKDADSVPSLDEVLAAVLD
jgi:3-hydroxyisobutyrate dehydrogenase-like beta-hydroxyacid dehydrogenase